MDKNLINIDDLLKQRLSGGEEQERPGAWLQMRELLDEKMPVKVAAAYNWRRMLTYAAGLLLLTTATIGSYKVYNAHSSRETLEDNNNLPATTRNNAATTGNVVAKDNTQQKGKGKKGTIAAAIITNKVEVKNKEPFLNSTANQQVSNKLVANGRKTNPIKDNLSTSTKSARIFAVSTASNSLKANKNIKVNAIKSSGNITSTDVINQAASNEQVAVATNAHQKAAQQSTTSNIVRQDIVQSGNTYTNNKERIQQDPSKTNPRYKKQQKVIDSADMIAVRETTRKGVRQFDTFSRGKMAREKYMAMAEKEATANSQLLTTEELVPYAGHQVNATLGESNTQAPLRNYKAESKKQQNYNPDRFEEMVKNAKINLSGVTFHPGLVFGVASSMGNYNMTGVQFGFVGMMNMSEHWSMFAELKAIYRFSNGKSLANTYNVLLDSNVTANQQTNYKYEERTNFYEFATNSSIDLPIALKYTTNRFNIFGGLNTTYNFAVNASFREEKYKHEYLSNNNSSEELRNGWKDNYPIAYSDFGARLSMGGVVGIGYQVNPAIGLDFRASKSVWDNVRTRGALQVSKDLYRTPNLQLNFTYRFSNNKYKKAR